MPAFTRCFGVWQRIVCQRMWKHPQRNNSIVPAAGSFSAAMQCTPVQHSQDMKIAKVQNCVCAAKGHGSGDCGSGAESNQWRDKEFIRKGQTTAARWRQCSFRKWQCSFCNPRGRMIHCLQMSCVLVLSKQPLARCSLCLQQVLDMSILVSPVAKGTSPLAIHEVLMPTKLADCPSHLDMS